MIQFHLLFQPGADFIPRGGAVIDDLPLFQLSSSTG
jgi:hypothetical protein